MSENHIAPILYTVGEPSGVGADILILLAQQQSLANVVCLGDKSLLLKRAGQHQVPIKICRYPQRAVKKGDISLIEHNLSTAIHTSEQKSTQIIRMLDSAIKGCYQGDFSAMVTGPIDKAMINAGGIAFSGHTEYIAQKLSELTKKDITPVMMLASQRLRVALITTHVPLSAVPNAISQKKIVQTVRIIHRDLQQKMAITHPKIVVCGVNPHAGEGGYLGLEEIRIITPALTQLKQEGIDVVGPLPADTAFTQSNIQRSDVIVAMYHDQGLPVLKALSFGESANITLGLPIIRTSVDHGTAYDKVGCADIELGSLRYALQSAQQMRQ